MSQYNFDFTRETRRFTVQIDTSAHYGYFEHHTLGDGCGGGLWFEPHGDTLELTDYDGVYILPYEVCTALHQGGAIVAPEFWPAGEMPSWAVVPA